MICAGRAYLPGVDMGTSVATELCARRERSTLSFGMESLTLMNGSVHIELAHLTPEQVFGETPPDTPVEKDSTPPEESKAE